MIFLAGNTLEFTNVCCYSQKPSSCSKLSWIARKLKRQKEKKKRNKMQWHKHYRSENDKIVLVDTELRDLVLHVLFVPFL